MCLCRSAGDIAKHRHDVICALGCACDIARYFAGCQVLLLDRSGDSRSVAIDLLHALGDLPDRFDRARRRFLDSEALRLTLDSSFSIFGRNEAMAESIVARRCSWLRMAARSCSAWRCSVTSSCVETQPPPCQRLVFGKHDAAIACLDVM